MQSSGYQAVNDARAMVAAAATAAAAAAADAAVTVTVTAMLAVQTFVVQKLQLCNINYYCTST